mmetsp:Transcript_88765/g.139057  ORF Transcript_88765/g.139057 Transcript_88765/m.139057 type:complete len:505 (+) Transcript_88765:247-1761(+)
MARIASNSTQLIEPKWALPSRFRAEVYNARSSTDALFDCYDASEGGRFYETCPAVEVARLEQKLYATQQRHEQEFARLMEASNVVAQKSPMPATGDRSARSPGGPILAARRRGRAIRMWVEDCCSLGVARVHAMDEASGSHNFVDVADSTLSAIVTSYRDSKAKLAMEVGDAGLTDDTNDLDCCLHILLESMCLSSSSADVVLELSLPSAARLCATAAAVATQQAPSHAVADLNCHDVRRGIVSIAATKPRRPIVRPHSAPQSSRRPQSARLAGREAVDRAHEELRLCAESSESFCTPRRRRARPTSAKALKHRRVIDDGVDSIIYEDVEEEEEEASDQGERVQESLGAGYYFSASRCCMSSRSASHPRQSVTYRGHNNGGSIITVDARALGSQPVRTGSRSRASSIRSERRRNVEVAEEDEAVTPPPKTPACQISERQTPCRPSRDRPEIRRPSQHSHCIESPLSCPSSLAERGKRADEVAPSQLDGQPSIVVPQLGARALYY